MKVDWLKIISPLVDFEVDEDYEIIMVNPGLIKATFEHLDSMDNRVFANIFASTFVFNFHKTYSLYFVNVFEHQLWGIANAHQRFEQCLSVVRRNLPVAFTSLLVKRFTNKKMIEDAYDIANRTMRIIINIVKNDETLPPFHRNFMVQKLTSLKLVLGYPEELLDDQKVEEFYRELNLTGKENFLKLELESLFFNIKEQYRNYIKVDTFGFLRNESSIWIDYTTEDEYLTPLYVMNAINTICKIFEAIILFVFN